MKAAQFMEETHELYFDLAYVYALLDDEAHAMPYLEHAYRTRHPGILFLRTAPEFDSIRSSPPLSRLGASHRFPPAAERY